MVLRRPQVLSFVVFAVLVAAAVVFVVGNWDRLDHAQPAGAVLVSTSSAPARPSTASQIAASAATNPASTPAAGAATSPADYFASAHLRRAQAESRELDQLQTLASDTTAASTVRAQAAEQILQLQQQQQEEADAEVVLQAKGYSPSLVMLHPGGATVVVQANGFDAAAAASVAQAVAAVASIDPAGVQIVTEGAPASG